MKSRILLTVLCLVLMAGQAWGESYSIVDTGQSACFDDRGQTRCPDKGDAFFGQDGQYKGNVPRYKNNGDGTTTDLVTGLTWVQARGQKMTWQQAVNGAKACRVGGHSDWRAPTIKELYSLIDFMGWTQRAAQSSTPFIDTNYFQFAYGNSQQGERFIDCQDWSSTIYKGTTMGGARTAFGVNFADGRIKGYPTDRQGQRHGKYMRYVRGNPAYGKNQFVDNRDGTISDQATGLRWQKRDSGKGMDWKEALSYCENMNRAGTTEWRLPNAKELQSIVDYTRSPTTTGSAAIDPFFFVTKPESYFWSSTTHMDGPKHQRAVYVAFGRAMGYFAPPHSNQAKRFLDVHGAGAQRSDPKSGDPGKYSQGHGPQGDDVRIYNYARCVTGGGVAYYNPENKSVGRFNHNMVDSNMGQQPGGKGMGPGKGQGGFGMMKHQGPPNKAGGPKKQSMAPGQGQGMHDSGSDYGDSGQVGFGQQNMQFGQTQEDPVDAAANELQQQNEEQGQQTQQQQKFGAQYDQPAPPMHQQGQQGMPGQQMGQQYANPQQMQQQAQPQQGVSDATCGGVPIGGQCTAQTPYGMVAGICRSNGPAAACVPQGQGSMPQGMPPGMPGTMPPGTYGGPPPAQ